MSYCTFFVIKEIIEIMPVQCGYVILIDLNCLLEFLSSTAAAAKTLDGIKTDTVFFYLTI